MVKLNDNETYEDPGIEAGNRSLTKEGVCEDCNRPITVRDGREYGHHPVC